MGPKYQENKIFFICQVYKHNKKFGKGWSPDSELMTGTNISALPIIKIDLLDRSFIKKDLFKVAVKFTPRVTPIGIVAKIMGASQHVLCLPVNK